MGYGRAELEGLALVELASDPFAQLGALEVAEDALRLDQLAIVLVGCLRRATRFILIASREPADLN